MTTKPVFSALVAVFALAGTHASVAVAKEKKPKLVSYKKDSGIGLGSLGGKLVHSYGYKDKTLANGNWQTTGQAKSKNAQDSQYIAIYRAAEIAGSAGKKYIRVVSVNGKNLSAVFAGSLPSGGTFSGPNISYGTRYVMEFTLSDEADSTDNCDTDVLKETCKTIDAASAIQAISPFLKIEKK